MKISHDIINAYGSRFRIDTYRKLTGVFYILYDAEALREDFTPSEVYRADNLADVINTMHAIGGDT